jgi:agmatine deiminase
VHQTRYAAICAMICFDQWYPEGARIAALYGAEIVFYPTAIGTIKSHTSLDGDWQAAWETVQRGNAIANGVHVCAVNRAGEEGRLQFWGGSFVCDSFGTMLAQAGANEKILVAAIDLSHNERIREGWGFLRHRRPDAYHKICDEK